MGKPYTLWIGYYESLEPAIILEDKVTGTDADGGGEYDVQSIVEYLNHEQDGSRRIVLPWIGNKRVRSDGRGNWYIQTREEYAADEYLEEHGLQ